MHIDFHFIYNSKFEVSHGFFFDYIVFAFVISGMFLCACHHRVEQRLDHVEFVFIERHSSLRWFSRAVVAVEVIETNVNAAVVVVHFYHRIPPMSFLKFVVFPRIASFNFSSSYEKNDASDSN